MNCSTSNLKEKLNDSETTGIPNQLLVDLSMICPGNQFSTNVSLADLSRWKVGGVAKCIVRPSSSAHLSQILQTLALHSAPYLVIGSTTNLLFADEGLSVVAIQIGNEMNRMNLDGLHVSCEAGIWVPGFARKLATAGLSGAEHVAGIPGTLGGLIYMNGGSQRKGIGDHIKTVRTLTADGVEKFYLREDCQFRYRASIFQEANEIITEATFEFRKGDPGTIRRELLNILRSRKNKFPQKLPNCGSVFVSDPAMYDQYGPPGKVIEFCGLKGLKQGGAQISPLHANFIVNNGAATAFDILYLINLIRERVKQSTGYAMKSEAIYVGSNGKLEPAHVRATSLFNI